MSELAKDELKGTEIHDLASASSFLFPCMRNMAFCKNFHQHVELKLRAEALMRKMMGNEISIPNKARASGLKSQ